MAAKAGMRGIGEGSRYDYEEMGGDVASAVIEAATAGVGGKLPHVARLAGATTGARGITCLGQIIGSKAGPKFTPIVNETISAAVSHADNPSMDHPEPV